MRWPLSAPQAPPVTFSFRKNLKQKVPSLFIPQKIMSLELKGGWSVPIDRIIRLEWSTITGLVKVLMDISPGTVIFVAPYFFEAPCRYKLVINKLTHHCSSNPLTSSRLSFWPEDIDLEYSVVISVCTSISSFFIIALINSLSSAEKPPFFSSTGSAGLSK